MSEEKFIFCLRKKKQKEKKNVSHKKSEWKRGESLFLFVFAFRLICKILMRGKIKRTK